MTVQPPPDCATMVRAGRRPSGHPAESGRHAAEDTRSHPEFLAAGLPIATGVVEGACRHLIQDRLGITGARWGLQGTEAILKLRALHCNGDWDDYWRFHCDREASRN